MIPTTMDSTRQSVATPRHVQRPLPAWVLRTRGRGRTVVGGFFLFTGGVHGGIVLADPRAYRHFADHSLFGFVRSGWHDIVMADPAAWGVLLMVGECLLGLLLLLGPRTARVGWIGVLVFHALLMVFGFGFWIWCLPAVAVLVPLALPDLVHLEEVR